MGKERHRWAKEKNRLFWGEGFKDPPRHTIGDKIFCIAQHINTPVLMYVQDTSSQNIQGLGNGSSLGMDNGGFFRTKMMGMQISLSVCFLNADKKDGHFSSRV